jgi:signal peptidase I
MDDVEDKKPINVPILGHGPTPAQRRRVTKEARGVARRVRKALDAPQVPDRPPLIAQESVRTDLRARVDAIEEALQRDDHDAICESLVRLEDAAERHLTIPKKSTFREYFDSMIFAVLVALILRAFVVEAFKIPSGSMIPTLEVGDHIFVNKFIYGLRIPFTNVKLFEWRKPHRGEVVVFIFPNDPSKDFIKRIVAVAGDTVQVIDDHVWVNGKEVPRHELPGRWRYWDYNDDTGIWREGEGVRVEEELDGHRYVTIHNLNEGPSHATYAVVAPYVVPEGKVFCMGDNRDNSNDSRFWGPVPLENIRGKAMVVWWSSQKTGPLWSRIGHVVE